MKIAAAQTIAVKGDIEANIVSSVKFIKQAIADRADLIFFPELSLTGYEPELSAALAITTGDERLLVFKELSVLHEIIIAVGAPIQDDENVLIGIIIFLPDGTVQLYTKQNLHPGEEQYFTAKSSNLQISVKDKIISFAICADFSNPEHAKQAADNNCTVYLASVLISKGGLKNDTAILKAHAENYGMKVIMANYGGISGGYNCAGHTAVWSDKGILEDFILGDQEGLLIVEA